MSEKEKKFKKKSRRLLSLPSFRKSKKLNQIKEDVFLDLKEESSSEISNKPTSKHGSDNSLPSLNLNATISLDSPRKENVVTDENLDDFGETNGASTPNSERRSFSNLRSAYHDNPDIVRNAVSPSARRLGLGGSYNLSTDSGIDCSILLSEKGSPEHFQEFTRREAERIRLEHLHLNNTLVNQGQIEQVEGSDEVSCIQNVSVVESNENFPELTGANTLQEQIEQTKEHISLLSELRTVLEQKLVACNTSCAVSIINNGETDLTAPASLESAVSLEAIENMNISESNEDTNQGCVSNSLTVGHNANSSENFNLYLHTNKTDEIKSEEARMRLENVASSFANSLIIDSPHLIVSPTPVISAAATANHRILPATPSPVRFYVNEKSAFAKCKSLKRSVSDVGKGLLGKLRQKKKSSDDNKFENSVDKRNQESVLEPLVRNQDTGAVADRDKQSDCSTFSAHLETSLLCDNAETDEYSYDSPSVTWEMADLNASLESSYETSSMNIELDMSQRHLNDGCNFDDQFKNNVNTDHSQKAISTIQELTTGICEMTSKLKLSPSQRSSANSIECMCNCKNRSDSPHCCDRNKTPSPSNIEITEYLSMKNCERNVESTNLIQDCNRSSVMESVRECDENLSMATDGVFIIEHANEQLNDATLNHPVMKETSPNNLNKNKNTTNANENSNQEDDIEIVSHETDSLLGHKSVRLSSSSSQSFGKRSVSQSEVRNTRPCMDSDCNEYMRQCVQNKSLCAEIEKDWLCCDTEGDSDDSSLSFCSGCSDEECSSRERKMGTFGADSSSGDTSPTDFNTRSSDKSTDSESESSSLECTPEKLTWQNASFDKDGLEKSPYSVSFMELNVDGLECGYLTKNVRKLERPLGCQMNSPQSNFPSPEVKFSRLNVSKTPASSPVVNFSDQLTNCHVNESVSSTDASVGCRRKDTYVDVSPERLSSQSHLSLPVIDRMTITALDKSSRGHRRSRSDLNSLDYGIRAKGHRRTESDLNVSELSMGRSDKQPDIIKDVTGSSLVPLDLSMRKDQNRNVESSKKPAFWVDKHVGQMFSPAKRVLHKNRNLSERDLCRNILDSYISDADESGFEPEFENSFSNSFNSAVNDSLPCNSSLDTSNRFNSPLDSSSVLEPGSSDEDSILQYGTYVAPRRPKKETNVDDFLTTVVSSCYTAEARTRKLQGGHSGSEISAAADVLDSTGTFKAPALPRSSQNITGTSQRIKPYNPTQYQSGRRRHNSLPTEESNSELLDKSKESMVRVKGRRETRDAEQNKDKIVESTKEEQVRVKGRRETRDMITGKAEVLETKKEQRIRALDRDATPVDVEPSALQKEEKVRVKGRRETRDMVLKDRTNTGKQSLSQCDKGSELSKSVPSLKQTEGKENAKLLDLSDNTFDRLTVLHTAQNGKRKVRCLSVYEAQSIVKHYPPPKQASTISWGQTLSEMDLSRHTPRKTPVKTKPILLQNKPSYPYEEDTPSPIVLTRLRRSKSLSKKFKNWPW